MRTNEEMFQELDEFIESLNYDKTELIAILHRAQHIFGYLPMVVQSHIAKKLKINVSKVYGVVTFYSYFRMEPKGQYVISVCLGTACFVRGSGKILEKVEEILKIKNGETTYDGKFSLTTLRCVGACGLAPVMTVNDVVHPAMTPDKAMEVIYSLKVKEESK